MRLRDNRNGETEINTIHNANKIMFPNHFTPDDKLRFIVHARAVLQDVEFVSIVLYNN